MFDKKRWRIRSHDPEKTQTLATSLGVGTLCAKLLLNRGYSSVEDATAYMNKSDSFLYNPYLLKDMSVAVSRIKLALEREEKITIYGDYDVDGVTSVSIFYMYLKDHGADVTYYIPTRDGEGYGLSVNAFDMIAENGTTLVITVDTGITALEEIAYARSIGLDVVVTDHHECRAELPVCDAVVNPRRADCPYPFKELSGVGVVFKVLCALELDAINGGEYNLFTIKDMCRRYIDLVTVGTIADVMPLCSENRIIVYMGLQLMSATKNIGLRALFRAIGIDLSKKITASTIGYTVAPRINAAGRIGNAERAVQLFLAKSPQAADLIAEELCAINRERQLTENTIYKEAAMQAEKEAENNVLVLFGNNWHPGVIGIVASRITERYGKPSILISFAVPGNLSDACDIGKGSARSVSGINIVKALESCNDLLIKYGGHELAAGMTLKRENLPAFQQKLNEYVLTHSETSEESEGISIESEIQLDDITMSVFEEISRLEPYGAQNPEPMFYISDVEIAEISALSQGKHTRILARQGDLQIHTVLFGYNLLKEGFSVGDKVDLVGTISLNEFRGKRTLQLILRDIDFSDIFYREIAEADRTFEKIVIGQITCERADIPTREEFIAAYRIITSMSAEANHKLSILKLSALLPQMSYIKIKIIVEAFLECNILAAKINGEKTEFVLQDITEKKNILATPIMKKLSAETE